MLISSAVILRWRAVSVLLLFLAPLLLSPYAADAVPRGAALDVADGPAGGARVGVTYAAGDDDDTLLGARFLIVRPSAVAGVVPAPPAPRLPAVVRRTASRSPPVAVVDLPR